jgi:hypothetical protein
MSNQGGIMEERNPRKRRGFGMEMAKTLEISMFL